MDNLFQLLIYLFIIYLFTSPFFKKKKTETKIPGEQNQNSKTPKEFPTPSVEKEDYAILKEIENLFKNEPTPAIDQNKSPQKSESNLDKNISLENRSIDYDDTSWRTQDTSWHSPTVSEHTENPNWSDAQTKSRMLKTAFEKTVEAKPKLNDQPEVVKKDPEFQTSTRIREIFRDQKSFRDYFIFSEIIGKPKALN